MNGPVVEYDIPPGPTRGRSLIGYKRQPPWRISDYTQGAYRQSDRKDHNARRGGARAPCSTLPTPIPGVMSRFSVCSEARLAGALGRRRSRLDRASGPSGVQVGSGMARGFSFCELPTVGGIKGYGARERFPRESHLAKPARIVCWRPRNGGAPSACSGRNELEVTQCPV